MGVDVRVVNNIATMAEKLEMNPKAKISFKELFDEYAEIKESQMIFNFDNRHYKLKVIEEKNPLVKEAYNKLGKERVEEMKYHQTNIRRELVKQLDIPTEHKIVQMLNSSIDYYTAIPITTVKDKIQSIYDNLNIERTAKATDLKY